ncbi:MAG: AmmeMemoRadiSam system radical SAM enzyme, partial [Candidatus Micrarchaeota archaeon]|nr:AmmeMemoRadiSam system radical SAM enzyme [Candidatus Micrarchaeota archaeon]
MCGLGFCGLIYKIKSENSFFNFFENVTDKKNEILDKWTKEALYYSIGEGGLLQCQKCPHECKLADGDTGFCRNRVNIKNKLYSIAYGNPCAVHIDPIEKKPFFHFLPAAKSFSVAMAGCNFRCLNCQNWQISQVSPKETTNYDLMPEETIKQCLNYKCETIAYTYSEPTTFYEYVLDTSKLARQKGIKNLLKSNGYINEKPLRQLCKYLDAANIDLKVFDDEIYRKISNGRLEPVLRNLKIFKEEGVWLEVTNLVIPNWTDDLKVIRKM